MSCFRFIFVVFVAAIVLTGAPARGQSHRETAVQVQAPGTMYAGVQSQVKIVVDGPRGSKPPAFPEIANVAITYVGEQDDSVNSVLIVNGQRIMPPMAFVYGLTPKAPGTFVIPSIDVTVNGRMFRTDPVSVVVRVVGAAANSSLMVKADRTEAFVGEPVRVQLTWAIGVELREYNAYFPIESEPESVEIIPGPDPRPANLSPFDRRFDRIRVDGEEIPGVMGTTQIGGRAVSTITIERYIRPKKPGTIRIGSARIDILAVVGQRPPDPNTFNPFADRAIVERQYVEAPALELIVHDLPTEGRPADFSGLVGAYSISAAADARDAAIGDPINLTMTVSGPYPLSLVPPLDLNRQPAFRGKFRLPRDPVLPDLTPTSARFDAILRPRTTDITQIGPIELTYFDPDAMVYKVAATKPIPLTVRAGTQVTLPEDEDSERATKSAAPQPELPGGLAGIDREPLVHAESVFDLERELRRPMTLLILGVPPLAFIAAAGWAALRRRRERDPTLRRRLLAARVFKRSIRGLQAGPNTPAGLDVLARALANFASDWSGEHADALTAPQAAAVFAAAGSPSGDRLAGLVRAIDSARFGMRTPADAAVPSDPVAESAKSVQAFVREYRTVKPARRAAA